MSEAAWQAIVEGLLTFYGWRWYHTHRSDRSVPGFPDIVAVRAGELLFAELKTEKGKLSNAQQMWIADLAAFAAEIMSWVPDGHATPAIGIYTWRPHERADVERILAGPGGAGVMVTGEP